MRCSFNTLSRPAALQNLSCWILSWTRLTSITGICTGSPGVELRSRCSETKFLCLSSMPGVFHSPRWLKWLLNSARIFTSPMLLFSLLVGFRSLEQNILCHAFQKSLKFFIHICFTRSSLKSSSAAITAIIRDDIDAEGLPQGVYWIQAPAHRKVVCIWPVRPIENLPRDHDIKDVLSEARILT